MLIENLSALLFLLLAAFLEAGGDAAIRMGLRGQRWGFLVGPVVLALYGFAVNLPRWDFSRLMGVYIAAFFVVAQLLAVVVFRERLQLPAIVGGALIITGGLVLTLWHPTPK